MRLLICSLFCLSLSFCSKDKVYTKYWHGNRPFYVQCRDSINLKYGFKYQYHGCVGTMKEIKHNERVDKKIENKLGLDWQNQLSKEASNCPDILDSTLWKN